MMNLARRVRVSQVRGRRAPVEYADAVEMWARGNGGHATLKWLEDPMNCWAVILSFKPNDPRAGTDADGEPVLLHDWKPAEWWAKYQPERARRHPRTNRIMPANYAYDLEELGISEIIERLDRGNILSGRGEFQSAEQAGRAQVEKFRTDKHRRRRAARDEASHRAKDRRRSLLGIPLLPGADFNDKGEMV